MGAFDGIAVGSRLILTRDAFGFAKAGDEVEVVAVLGPGDSGGAVRSPNDGIKVRRTDGSSGGAVDFIWACGRRYFE